MYLKNKPPSQSRLLKRVEGGVMGLINEADIGSFSKGA
jgi:hypothetical protein